jgi:hypothetical protein
VKGGGHAEVEFERIRTCSKSSLRDEFHEELEKLDFPATQFQQSSNVPLPLDHLFTTHFLIFYYEYSELRPEQLYHQDEGIHEEDSCEVSVVVFTMCRHYRGSLETIAPVVLLPASPEQTITEQEGADTWMENNHEENRQGEHNSTTAVVDVAHRARMAAWATSASMMSTWVTSAVRFS